ncbi:MAG: shikimate kinase, partial [Bacillota bacterium]|nr:shikimate kinase [Bacillota bacterium]
MNNVILIGMPGCGKSTLGVLLAKSLGMTFLDTDLVIQDREHALLSQLIRTHGSDGFLALEESICAQLDVNNSVIATGGSVVY